MINRTLMRTRVLQVAYAYYMNQNILSNEATHIIEKSFKNTHKLYIFLLLLIIELTKFAEEKCNQTKQMASVIHKTITINRRFLDNQFTHQLANNKQLLHFANNYNLNWNIGPNAIESIYKELLTLPLYQDYLNDTTPDYEKDKKIWIDIFLQIIINNDILNSVLEEMEIATNAFNLVSDLDVVISYIIKTIRFFNKNLGPEQQLLQLFDKEETPKFALQLFKNTIQNKDTYLAYLNKYLINWDENRVAFMDKLIIQMAVAEIFTFNDIFIEVTLNEYIELAREFSSEKSHIFVNGILNKIVDELKEKQCLPKLLMMKKESNIKFKSI